MKRLVILLLIANGAVYLYGHFVDASPTAPIARTAPLPPTILTAAERPAPTSQCQSLGPMANRPLVMAVTAWLGDRFGAVSEREDSLPAPPEYRVQVDTESADLATRLAQRLRASGAGDIAVLPPEPGDTKVIVAMGLFADRANADRRLQEVRRRGIDAHISEMERHTSQWWLNFTAVNSPDHDALVRAIPAAAAVTLAPCELSLPGEEQPTGAAPDASKKTPVPPAGPSTGLPAPKLGVGHAKGAVV